MKSSTILLLAAGIFVYKISACSAQLSHGKKKVNLLSLWRFYILWTVQKKNKKINNDKIILVQKQQRQNFREELTMKGEGGSLV